MGGSREKPPATRALGAAMRERGNWAFVGCDSPRGSGFGFPLARGSLGRATRPFDASPRPVGADGLDILEPEAALFEGARGRNGGRVAIDGAGGTALVATTTDRLADTVRLTAPLATPGAGMLCLAAGEAATVAAALPGPRGAGTLGRTDGGSCFLVCCR